MVGAVAGSPGTLPTNYVQLGGGGLTRTVSLGVENGLQYVDLRYQGTATEAFIEWRLDTTSAITALPSQVWLFTNYVKLVSGSLPALFYPTIYARNAATSIIQTWISSAITLNSNLTRYSHITTSTPANTAFVQAANQVALTIGTTYDFTIRIAAPQMELGAYATTFIKTSTAAVTRLVDTPVLSNAVFLPTAYPFTLFAHVDIADTTTGFPISFSNNAVSSNYYAIVYATNIWSAQSRPNTTTVSADGAFTTARGAHKVAAVFTSTTIKMYVDGVSVATATNTQPFNTAINDLNVGLLRTTTDNGIRTSIFQSAVFNRELTNTELAQITTL
jgi:hypothetical protein